VPPRQGSEDRRQSLREAAVLRQLRLYLCRNDNDGADWLRSESRRGSCANSTDGNAPMTEKVNTAGLERIAKAVDGMDQARRWNARRNGLLERGAASEVRSLKDDVEAGAQAEASLQRAMMKPAGKKQPFGQFEFGPRVRPGERNAA
jgi:hypothetical protein